MTYFINAMSTFDNTLILAVIGTFKLCDKIETISLTLVGFLSNAEPIPPFIEKSLGHPIFMSIPDTSFSLQMKQKNLA